MNKIKVKLSEIGYNEKPNVEDLIKITVSMKKSWNNHIVTYKNIANMIKNGYSVLLADYKEDAKDIYENNINSLSCIALDIDSKENKITMYEMISLIYKKFGVYPVIEYRTFSDVDYSKFRLIYRLENKVDVETYRSLYKALQWKFSKYLDAATHNANRIWAGTNKDVNYRENDIPFSFITISKLIRTYNNKKKREEVKKTIATKKSYANIEPTSYIKTEHKKDVIDYLIDNIDLREFMPKHLGGTFKRMGDNIIGRCILHNGDNPNALVISKKIYTCFTHCGTGNIITIARKVYNEDHFSTIAFTLAKEYNLNIPSEFIKEV